MRKNNRCPAASVYGTGIDIVEIDRIREAYLRHKTRFINRLFTKTESEYCLAFRDPSPQLAVRFAAKEAVAKALGTGVGKELSWLDIEISKGPRGKPLVCLLGDAAVGFDHPSFFLSMSHCRTYAIAQVLWIVSTQ